MFVNDWIESPDMSMFVSRLFFSFYLLLGSTLSLVNNVTLLYSSSMGNMTLWYDEFFFSGYLLFWIIGMQSSRNVPLALSFVRYEESVFLLEVVFSLWGMNLSFLIVFSVWGMNLCLLIVFSLWGMNLSLLIVFSLWGMNLSLLIVFSLWGMNLSSRNCLLSVRNEFVSSNCLLFVRNECVSSFFFHYTLS